MTETVHPEKSPSPFLSVFRKKRPSPANVSAPGDLLNGSGGPMPPPKPQKSSPQMSFTQRVKMHKDLRSGKIPDFFVQSSQSQIIPSTSLSPFPLFKKGEKNSEKLKKRNKALSADAINHMDPNYLTEALEAIGDEQPMVARSIPKHAVLEIDPQKDERRQRDNCLYEPEVYDKMLAESLMVCDMLQMHLNECITNTRAKSPMSPTMYSPARNFASPMTSSYSSSASPPTIPKINNKSILSSSSSSKTTPKTLPKPSKKLTYAV